MKKLYIITGILWLAVTGVCAQKTTNDVQKETPNERQARRLFDQAYNMVYGPKGSSLHYAVNIVGLYKTEGTIWTKGKKSRFSESRYLAWNDDVTYTRVDKKKRTVTIYDAHDEERDKYASKFTFIPDNYRYSIKDDAKGYYITLHAKKGVKGIKEARVLLDKKTRYPINVRVKVGIFHTTIKITHFKSGDIDDNTFAFPRQQYLAYETIDNR